MTIGEPAIPVDVIIWYQVYRQEQEVFGFAVKNGVVKNFPIRKFIGMNVKDIKWWFRGEKAEVVKICEQVC